MTTAYRRVECEHEQYGTDRCCSEDLDPYECPGYTYVPWPEVEALVEAAEDQCKVGLSLEPLRTALTNLRSEG